MFGRWEGKRQRLGEPLKLSHTEAETLVLYTNHLTVLAMARVRLNPIIDGVSGKIGDLVFRSYGDDTVLSRTPDFSNVESTPGQEAQRVRFREAAFYGRTVMADPAERAIYEAIAERRGQPVFSVMVGDFLNEPVVDEIEAAAYTGAVGDPVTVRAHDDVEVMEVLVTLTDAGGAELESGAAVLDGARWRYDAQTAVASGTDVTIMARVLDRPGNAGELAETVTTP